MTIVVERTSVLAAPATEVWRHATSMAGVNRELAPVLMSHPPDRAELTPEVPLGETLFTATLRLGPIPFDRHRLRLVEYVPHEWFQEDSASILNRRWRHRRTITPLDPSSCRLTDLVEVTPRLPGSTRPTRWVVERVFARRHAVLRRIFATTSSAT